MHQLSEENKLLKDRLNALEIRSKRLEELLLPVCEFAAEIYNRGNSTGIFPLDTIQRLNSAYKLLVVRILE